MPLKEGSSRETVSQNIETEMAHGKEQPQAVAIALKQAGRSNQDEPVRDYEPVNSITLPELQANNRKFWAQASGTPAEEVQDAEQVRCEHCGQRFVSPEKLQEHRDRAKTMQLASHGFNK